MMRLSFDIDAARIWVYWLRRINLSFLRLASTQTQIPPARNIK